MPKLRTSLVVAVSMSVLAACKDDPVGVNSGDPLTEAEIQAFFYALSDAFSAFSTAPAAVGPAQATTSYDQSFDASAPCPTSGTMAASVSVHATVTDAPSVVDANYQARVTPSHCVVPTEGGSITVDGSPYVQMALDFSITETSISFEGTESGGIAFTSSDGRTGSCLFDVSFSGTATSTSGSSSVSGTVCGVSVNALEAFSVD
jgi:hypothetical protein